ncbi:MAG: hypothetical protein HRU36_00430 [Rickettsiales bacterium]|nr:hypothetical protein [Rickettsiales bacterium]
MKKLTKHISKLLALSAFFIVIDNTIVALEVSLPSPQLVCFNVGSSTTKITLYSSNAKDQVSEIKKIKIRTKSKSYIENDILSQDGINALFQAFSKVGKDYNIDCKQIRCTGIATSWSRLAQNGYKIINDLNQAFYANIVPLSQKEEGVRAFKAVEDYLYSNNISNKGLVVLDAGGGSYQVNYRVGKEVVVKGQEYSVENESTKKFGDKILNINEIEMLKKIIFSSLHSNFKNIPQRKIGYAIGRNLTGWPDFIVKKGYITKDEARNLAISISHMSEEEASTKFPNIAPISMQRSAIFIQVLMRELKLNKIYFAEDLIDFCLGSPKNLSSK